MPALLFVGEADLAFRTNTIVGLFAVNRRAGALWALVNDNYSGYDVYQQRAGDRRIPVVVLEPR